MDTLIEEELREVNTVFSRYENAHRNCALFMGGSLVSSAALPVLVLVCWLLGSTSILRGALVGGACLLIGFALAFWWRFRRGRLFSEIQVRCLKLQRAGYAVFKKPVFLHNEISATTEALASDREGLDFAKLNADELHYRMI